MWHDLDRSASLRTTECAKDLSLIRPGSGCRTVVMSDYDALRLQEMASISDLAHSLTDEQWEHASLCAGWRVRDVISHMCLGYTTPMPSMVVMIGRAGFNVDKASLEGSVDYGSAHSQVERT